MQEDANIFNRSSYDSFGLALEKSNKLREYMTAFVRSDQTPPPFVTKIKVKAV